MKTIKNIDSTNQIFKYLNPKNNDILSEMKGQDIQELLYYLEEYYLLPRKTLGLNQNITFGLELEFERAKIPKIEKELIENKLAEKWILKNDLSLTDGGEINSPILTDTQNNWIELIKICNIIEKNAIIDRHCGGHIHIGQQAIGCQKQSWMNLINLWSTYENIIYRFVYGDYLNARYTIQKYASPIAKDLKMDNERIKRFEKDEELETEDIINMISHRRCQAVNFYNINTKKHRYVKDKKNTIEFRCPNGTLDPIIWQNNVNLFVKLLNYVKSPNYNNDIIEKRKNIYKDKYTDLYWYSEIYLEQSLELCDMIFTNNLDKIYFLKQYIKDFEVNNKGNAKAKTFTRKLF